MSQADAWRYRPLANQLQRQRERLRMNWEDAARVDTAASNRVRNNGREYIRQALSTYRARNPWYRERGFSDVVKAGALAAWPIVAPQVWNLDESDVARSGRPATAGAYSSGTYDAAAVPWRGEWPRQPKGWDVPDQPWPDEGGGQGSGGGATGKSIYSNVRYERY